MATFSLEHRVHQAPPAAAQPPLLVLLHGFGSNMDDLFGLVPYLPAGPVVVCPQAPHALGHGSFAWFNLDFSERGIGIDPQEAHTSVSLVAQFLAEAITAYHADPARVFLGGFSQGGMITAGVLLSQPELLAGALILSGMVPREIAPRQAEPAALAHKPVLVQHGTRDQVLPIGLGRAGRDTLQALGVDLTYHEYPIGHEVSGPSLADLVAWLASHQAIDSSAS